MPNHALDERTDLCATLRAAGPDAPTLCSPWTTAQLSAHLVLRERSLTELAGRIPMQRMRDMAQRAVDKLVAEKSYEQIVSEFEAGPPKYSLFAAGAVRESLNLLEYVVHHEDVRRAVPGWEPRVLPDARREAVWSKTRRGARLMMRSLPLTVRLISPPHRPVVVGRGKPRVTITGEPVELLMFAFGRQRAAHLEYEGTDEDIKTATEAKLGF